MSGGAPNRPRVTLVVACARNGVIGFEGDMPWRLSADLKHFRQVTMGHRIIMGRRTYDAIGRPLPGRINVVLSRDPGFSAEGIERAGSIDEALTVAAERGEREVMIIGGGQIYAAALPLASRIWLTEVDAAPSGDTYFPSLEDDQWVEAERREHPADERNDHAVVVRRLERVGRPAAG